MISNCKVGAFVFFVSDLARSVAFYRDTLGLPVEALEEIRTSVEREVIETSLKKHGNNVSETARRLGVSRVTLYRMIDRLKIVL